MAHKEINICIASDDWYAEHMHVAIFSLIYNLDKQYYCNVYILDGGINIWKKENITKMEKTFKNIKIHFIKVDEEKYKQFPVLHLTKEMYYRVEIPEIFKDLDRMLYLDCDIIVDKDISIIFDTDLEWYAIWAPTDIWTFFHYRDIMHIPSDYGYFNSWVLLMNLDYMRENKISDKIFEYIRTHKLITWDQDAINAILWNHRKELSPRYNAGDLLFSGYNVWWYNSIDFKGSRKNPVVIHYAWNKPWKKYCTHPLAYKYHKYRKLSWLKPIIFDKNFDFKLWFKNKKWKLWVFLLTHIPRKYYYYMVFKPKMFLSK